MRVQAIVLAAVALLPIEARAQAARPPAPTRPGARLTWASCRVLPPSTIQLIWHPAASGARFSVQLSLVRPGTSIALDTTSDTTFTRASLPAGQVRVVVEQVPRSTDSLTATASVPILPGGLARCGGP